MAAPGVFGRALIESPSLFVANRRILKQSLAFHAWPARAYLAIGTKEVGRPDKDARTVHDVKELAGILRGDGLDDTRLRLRIDEGAPHSESAWATRFPEAIEFLFSETVAGSGSDRTNLERTNLGGTNREGSPHPARKV
jgi:predicted alpha/beta superfamily hydrolase